MNTFLLLFSLVRASDRGIRAFFMPGFPSNGLCSGGVGRLGALPRVRRFLVGLLRAGRRGRRQGRSKAQGRRRGIDKVVALPATLRGASAFDVED